MRIAFSSRQFLPTLGGSIQFVCLLSRAFRDLGAEVCILTRTKGDDSEFAGIPVYRNPSRATMRQIARWADVLLQVDSSWRDALAFISQGVPWFPTVHFGPPHKPRDLKHRLALLGLAIAFRNPRSIAVSESARRSWNIAAEAIANPYDDSVFHRRDAAPYAQRTIDILFAGRVEKSKGVFNLVEAVQCVPLPRLSCCIVGDGPDLASLKTFASTKQDLRHSSVAQKTPIVEWRFEGRQPPEKVAAFMRESKIVVLPTTLDWVEASPLVLLEGLACGCRVVASDSGGACENLGPDGTLVAPGDIDGLANALRRTLDADDHSRDWASIDAFLQQRQLHAVAKKYLERFQSVPPTRQPRRRLESLPAK